MQKWILSALLGFIMQGTAMVGAVEAPQFNGSVSSSGQGLEKAKKELSRTHHHHHQGQKDPSWGRFASYWLTNQPSLTTGQNVLFNLQQTLEGIQYDNTTGIFTLPAGVYTINFFATPNQSFVSTLNLLVNGTVIPTPNLAGATIVIDLSQASNTVAVQATGDWSPQTGDIGSYFFAYASIVIYQVGGEGSWNPSLNFDQYACLYSSIDQTLTTGQNVLFGNQISLSGITYNAATGVFTLQPGTYSVTYFSTPVDNINLVANGAIVPNSPLGGSATILTLSNPINTLALQAQASTSLTLPETIPECNAMITIYQID